jgi:phage terminase large subunit GpA-like protein
MEPGDPKRYYLCEHNACVIKQQELDFSRPVTFVMTGIWTRDGLAGSHHRYRN